MDYQQAHHSAALCLTLSFVFKVEQASANEEVVGAYRDQFDLDRRTLLDVLDAQNELFVSRSNTINNEVVEMFAIYRLLALKGELLPTLNVAYQDEVDPSHEY